MYIFQLCVLGVLLYRWVHVVDLTNVHYHCLHCLGRLSVLDIMVHRESLELLLTAELNHRVEIVWCFFSLLIVSYDGFVYIDLCKVHTPMYIYSEFEPSDVYMYGSLLVKSKNLDSDIHLEKKPWYFLFQCSLILFIRVWHYHQQNVEGCKIFVRWWSCFISKNCCHVVVLCNISLAHNQSVS